MLRQIFGLGSAILLGALLAPVGSATATRSETATATDPPVSAGWLTTLEGVSADAPDDAWAVGWSHLDQRRKTFIEHWDGASWQVVASPNQSPREDDVLTSVTALAPDDVWAAGFYQTRTRGDYRALVLHYDGTSWTHVRTPSGHHYTELSGISAASPDDVWAVGSITQHSGQWYRPLFEHWDGTSWRIVDDTAPRRRNGPVEAVSAVSGDDVWAAGARTLFHRGDDWVPVRHVAGVQSVDMDSATDGWAAGGGIVLHWDGHAWHRVDEAIGYLSVVTAISPTDAWAGGDDLEHWDGERWTAVDNPGGDVFAMDGLSPDDVWAVGGYPGPAMIERWNGTTWTVFQR